MPTESPLPRNFLRPALLLLLREQPGHGYDLLERLRTLGFAGDDPGGLYRALRRLEHDGLVASSWESSEAGPDRRSYRLTRTGTEELHLRAKELAMVEETIADFLARYREFVALPTSPSMRRALT